VSVPIVAGIMPIISCTQLQRFSEGCGAEIPRWILKRLQEFGDDRVSIRKFGVDVTTELCEQLLTNGAPGLHFYTMNQSVASVAIWKNLGIDQRVND
jgi:methylenetetrahydrofolate reductase (NADPH)